MPFGIELNNIIYFSNRFITFKFIKCLVCLVPQNNRATNRITNRAKHQTFDKPNAKHDVELFLLNIIWIITTVLDGSDIYFITCTAVHKRSQRNIQPVKFNMTYKVPQTEPYHLLCGQYHIWPESSVIFQRHFYAYKSQSHVFNRRVRIRF